MNLDRPALRDTRGLDAPRLRWILTALAVAAIILATIAQLERPPRGQGPFMSWLAAVFVPGTIVLLFIAGRGLRALVTASILIYIEAVLLAYVWAIGMAFAILLPMIAIGLLGPYLRGWSKLATYVAAVVVATVAVILIETGITANPLGQEQAPLAIIAFALVAAFSLGLTWHTAERLSQALDAAGREIDARAAAESRLRETAETLERLLASSPLATLAIDSDRRVSVWNPAAERLFGWPAADVLGASPPFLEADGGERQQGSFDGLAQPVEVVLGGSAVAGELVACRDGAGRERLLEVHAAPRRDERGDPRGAIVQVVDVTDRSALEAQLRQAQKMEAVGQLAGGIAHDVNNTLTAVGGFAEIIENETADEQVKADAQMISGAVVRASELIRRLLAFARRSVLQPQAVDLGEFLTTARPLVDRLLGSKVEVVVEHGAPGATIKVDPGQLEQAILNLAVNSRDAMPAGGVLTISTRREPSADPTEAGGWVVLTVADTGVGIPPELQDQVFEPFVTTKARGQGSGLGLAMVYGFVKQSGGEVTLRSTPGEGTAVTIRLPEVAERPRPMSPVEPAPPAGGNETILLIEDEVSVAEVIRKALAGLGYEVLDARSGAQAVELAAAHPGPVGLVLSDVIMPGMNGPESVAAVLRSHPEAAVLYVSGYTADALAVQGVLPADVELLHKPFGPGELAARVRAMLDRRAAAGRDAYGR